MHEVTGFVDADTQAEFPSPGKEGILIRTRLSLSAVSTNGTDLRL
jgi:hypothetical protein